MSLCLRAGNPDKVVRGLHKVLQYYRVRSRIRLDKFSAAAASFGGKLCLTQ
jgi:hypothetical protein